jgi:hypothetical protein
MIGTETITKANGDVRTIVGDMIEHRRLQVDTRKWALSKPCRAGVRSQHDEALTN